MAFADPALMDAKKNDMRLLAPLLEYLTNTYPKFRAVASAGHNFGNAGDDMVKSGRLLAKALTDLSTDVVKEIPEAIKLEKLGTVQDELEVLRKKFHDQVGQGFIDSLMKSLDRDNKDLNKVRKDYETKIHGAQTALEKLQKTAAAHGKDAAKFAKVMQETNKRKKQLEVLNIDFFEKMTYMRDQQYQLTLEHIINFMDAQYEYVGQAYARLHELQPDLDAMKSELGI